MKDLKPLYQSIDDTKKAISEGNRELAEKLGWEMCNLFEVSFQVDEDTYTPEMCRLQLDCLATILELHIMREDPIDISFRYGQFLKKYRMDMDHFPDWTDEDRKPAVEIAMRMTRKVEQFYSEKSRAVHQQKAVKPGDIKCLLCKKNPADKPGSHMVPHLLIARTFSFDGSKNREKVVVDVTNLSEGYREKYFGHHVYDDTVNELIGRSLTDDEIEEENRKVNALTRDYVFCEECEKRFSTIESYYAEILDGKKGYPPEIPYLFWLSVMWRMSVGDMGCKMDKDHEEKLRKVLDKCLTIKRENIVTKRSKLGYCAYSLYRAKDTRDETLSILGHHTATIPYQALIGDILINFYVSSCRAHSFCKQHHLPEEDLNEGQEPEKVGDLSFIEFWRVKRQILDENWNHDRSVWNLGTQQHQTLSRFEKLDVDDFMNRMGFIQGKGEFHDDYSAWMTSENPNVIMFPRSIRKILMWMKEHNNEMSLEKMSEDLGYTQEELLIMLDYFAKQTDIIEAKEKQFLEDGQMLDELLKMDKSVFHN